MSEPTPVMPAPESNIPKERIVEALKELLERPGDSVGRPDVRARLLQALGQGAPPPPELPAAPSSSVPDLAVEPSGDAVEQLDALIKKFKEKTVRSSL